MHYGTHMISSVCYVRLDPCDLMFFTQQLTKETLIWKHWPTMEPTNSNTTHSKSAPAVITFSRPSTRCSLVLIIIGVGAYVCTNNSPVCSRFETLQYVSSPRREAAIPEGSWLRAPLG